jgi:ABC-2 type transport system permease protein
LVVQIAKNSRLRLTVLKYGTIMMMNLQNQLAYVWDALGRAFFIILIMFIFVQLWSVVYESQGTTEIAGLTLTDTIWYFLIAEMIELGKFRHDERISEEVKDGSIAYTLIRPYNYLAYHFFNGLGESLVKMVLIFLLGLPIVLFYAGFPHITLQSSAAFLIVLFLAVLLDFCMASIIGLLAFVVEDTFPFRLIYQKLIFIIGGLLIPLDFLPLGLQRIARLLPFSQVTYAPAKMFVAFDWPFFMETLVYQFFWIAGMGAFLFLQYRWAKGRLAVNGG